MKKALPALLLTVMTTAGSVIAQQEDETYSPYAKGYTDSASLKENQ